MSAILRLTLPLAPSLNNAYENQARGRRLSNEGARYKRQTVLVARTLSHAQDWTYEPGQRLAIAMRFWFPSAQSNAVSDIDNRFKLAGDALATALGYNDNVVDLIRLERAGVDTTNPRCEVAIKVLEAPEPVRRAA